MSPFTPGLGNADNSPEPLTTSNVVVGPTSLSRFNWRIVWAISLGGMLWIAPYLAGIAILIPALVAQVDEAQKVAIVGVIAITGALVGLVVNIIIGALSDATHTRIGARAPWVIIGGVIGAVSLLMLSSAETIPVILLWWCVYLVGLNSLSAPMLAVIADEVPDKYRGTVSALYGVGLLIGGTLSSVVAASFISAPRTGIAGAAALTILSAIVFLTLMPLRSNKGAERRHTSFRSIAKNFRPPVKGARDYYFALIAKFCFTAGGFAITNYQLYILTDYIRLNPADAAGLIAINGLLTLGASVIFGFTSGPLSDKLRRRKPFVIAAALLVGLGVLFPLLAPASWAFLAYGLLGGIGSGIFTSVDQALNIDVLPDKSQAAKDLGILNIGTTAGQLAGPVIMSVLVLTTGGYSAGFVAVLVLMVLAAAFILPIKKVR